MDIRTKEEKKFVKEPQERQRPIQGLYSLDKDVMQKCCQGPFKVFSASIPAKPGIRYFLHSVHVSLVNAAGNAGTNGEMLYTVDGTDRYYIAMIVPSAANISNSDCVLDLLTDENKAITITNTDVGAANWQVYYCEVPV